MRLTSTVKRCSLGSLAVRPGPLYRGEGGGRRRDGPLTPGHPAPPRARDQEAGADDGVLRAHRIPGNARWNVAPWSGFAVAQSRPRWLSMIERLIESPMPSPPGFVV